MDKDNNEIFWQHVQSEAWGASAACEALGREYSIFKLRHATKANERRPETSVTWLPDAEPSFRTVLKTCVLHFSRGNCKCNQVSFLAGIINRLDTCIFPSLRTQQIYDPSTQLIEVDGWSSHWWKIRNGDESPSGGTGPWISISFSPWCFQLFGDVWSLFRHSFSKNCVFSIFLSFQFWINTFLEIWWCFGFFLTAISTQNSYHFDEGPFIIHWFPFITHNVAQLDLPCHQFVFLTHLRLRQWRCSRLCWCPACKEAVVCGKWFAHWQWTLCWQNPVAFTFWWINPVDRLTCSRCDALRTNILKQLLKSQLDITWNGFPSILGGVQNLPCQKIEQCTKQMNRMHVCNAFDYARLCAQSAKAGFVQHQCYCKDIQLMKRSENR